MNRTRIILILMLLPLAGFSQAYINKSKAEVKKELGISLVGADSSRIIETDSSITRRSKGPGGIHTEVVCIFDKSGKCSSEKTTTNCDTCYKMLLKAVLDNKKYAWKPINLNQSISKFSEGLFLETQASADEYSLMLSRTNLDKKMYDFLMKDN